jgi:hypothetical protein
MSEGGECNLNISPPSSYPAPELAIMTILSSRVESGVTHGGSIPKLSVWPSGGADRTPLGAIGKPTHPNLNLTPEEKRVFYQLFQAADTTNLGVVTGETAVSFFERTKLPPDTLGLVRFNVLNPGI